MSERFIDEFLFRGRPPGSNEAAEWHVAIAEARLREDGRIGVENPRTMTPEQAEKEGFTLPIILAAINAAALQEADMLRTQLVVSQDMHRMSAEALDRVASERDGLIAENRGLRERLAASDSDALAKVVAALR